MKTKSDGVLLGEAQAACEARGQEVAYEYLERLCAQPDDEETAIRLHGAFWFCNGVNQDFLSKLCLIISDKSSRISIREACADVCLHRVFFQPEGFYSQLRVLAESILQDPKLKRKWPLSRTCLQWLSDRLQIFEDYQAGKIVINPRILDKASEKPRLKFTSTGEGREKLREVVLASTECGFTISLDMYDTLPFSMISESIGEETARYEGERDQVFITKIDMPPLQRCTTAIVVQCTWRRLQGIF